MIVAPRARPTLLYAPAMSAPPDGFDEPFLRHLLRAGEEACAVGSAIVAAARRPSVADAKGAGDYVTEADRRSEDAIREHLARATPDIPTLGEEAGGERGDVYWAVDPLDGTTNFLLGLPVVGVSVALVASSRPVIGAVRAPFLDLAFSGARGLGAFAGERPLRVSDRRPDRAVVATGFPFRHKDLLPRYLPAFETVLREAEDLRRAGAAALDLAWVAAAVFDGFFELGLSVWDVAAGGLLVQEAGGLVTDWDGRSAYLGGDVLAGSPATHRLLRRAATASDGA